MKNGRRSFLEATARMLILLPVASVASAQSVQSVQTVRCPVPSESYKCIASNEVCGWRYQRPTAAELEDAKRGGLIISAPCPTLPNGITMELCWIDRTSYCKAPSAADIARAEQAKREREAKARREELARERRETGITRETARLGTHREAEARRLVEMRERAEAARAGNGIPSRNLPTPPVTERSEPAHTCTPRLKQGSAGFGVGFRYSRQRAEEVLRNQVALICGYGGYALASAPTCTSGRVVGTASGEIFESWGCNANYVCTKATVPCPGKSGRGTAQ